MDGRLGKRIRNVEECAPFRACGGERVVRGAVMESMHAVEVYVTVKDGSTALGLERLLMLLAGAEDLGGVRVLE